MSRRDLEALIQRLFTILRIDLGYMYAIVFAMVVKPTSDDDGPSQSPQLCSSR